MKIRVNGTMVELDPKNVKMAEKLINSFIASVKDNAAVHKRLSMYLTTIVVMHIISGDILKVLDPEVMKILTKDGEPRG